MARRSLRMRRYFSRLRKRMGKNLRKLCCFLQVTEDDSGHIRNNKLTTEALKMFHSTNISDAYSDTTSMWSSEDGLQSTFYYPVNTFKQIDNDDDSVDGSSCQSHHEVSTEGDNESLLSDTTSSLLRFMDEMDNDSITDVSSIASNDEYDDDSSFTTVSDMTDFTDDLFDDDNGDVMLKRSLFKVDFGVTDNALSVATSFLDKILSDVAYQHDQLNCKY
nr:dentin sialophosphoprotein-like [Lytechinus pictus]